MTARFGYQALKFNILSFHLAVCRLFLETRACNIRHQWKRELPLLALYMICWLAALPEPTLPAFTLRGDADTLVICPPDFRFALQPWIEYRREQGHRILVQPPPSTSFELLRQIRKTIGHQPLKNIVLIGDSADQYSNPNRLVPTDYVTAKVNVRYGSEPLIATDNTFADIDDDGVVDLTIGRMPVDSSAELTRYIDRVIEYERCESCGPWQRRVNFVAGVGGFGQVIDSMIEQTVKRIVTDLIPSQYDTTMTYGNWRSPWCPDPRQFSSTAIDRFNEGCLFWVYIGHGHRHCLDQVRMPDRCCNILDNRIVSQISVDEGAPIAIFLSCYTAATDDPVDGLAENMLKQQKGPIAAISSTRVSMPYAMSIFSLEMLDGYFAGETDTLGELVLQSKCKMVGPQPADSKYHQMIESLARSFSPDPDLLNEEKLEHIQLMHLLGDPLLRLKRPGNLELQSPVAAKPGETVTVTGTAPCDGEIKVDLAYRRDRFRTRPQRRRHYVSTSASFDAWQATYQQAQNQVCASISTPVGRGPFSIRMQIPADCNGACHIRAMLNSPNHFSLGSNDIDIEDR